MTHVIITADDYGMCESVNKAIEAGIENGFITSTNVLVNIEEDSLQQAGALREKYPGISIGIHWNVTTGKPTLQANKIPSLVNDNGYFHSIEEFKRRAGRGIINRNELMNELLNQAEIFNSLCSNADYWNTHENSSLCRRAYPVFEQAAQTLGISATRNFQRVYIDYDQINLKRRLREIAVRTYINWWFKNKISKVFYLPDARLFPFDYKSKYDIDNLIACLISNNGKIVELVVHPATAAGNPLFGNVSAQRIDDYNFVVDNKVKKRLTSAGIKWESFKLLTKVNT